MIDVLPTSKIIRGLQLWRKPLPQSYYQKGS